jgi:hypothetical protein
MMTDINLMSVAIDDLRAHASAGESASSLLRRLQQLFGRTDCKLISVQCFHEAFDAGVASVSAVAGWSGFGGELTDAEVDSLLHPVLEGYRARK